MTIARRQRRKPFIIATAFEFSTPLLSITDYGWAAWAMFFRSVEAGMPVTCMRGNLERGWHPRKGFTAEGGKGQPA